MWLASLGNRKTHLPIPSQLERSKHRTHSGEAGKVTAPTALARFILDFHEQHVTMSAHWTYHQLNPQLGGRGVWEEGREGGKVGEMEVLSQRSRESSRGKESEVCCPSLRWMAVSWCLVIWGSESFFSEGLTCGAFVRPGLNVSLFRGFCICFCQVSWDYHRSGSTFYVRFSLWRFLNHSGRMNLDPRSM